MPAIQPARIKQQAALLGKHFNNPTAYTRSLAHLLEYYADRTYRSGQAGEPKPLLEAYRVHPQVLRTILFELSPLAKRDSSATLNLCDTLWSQPFLEYRLLATGLLGFLPEEHAGQVVVRVQTWITESTDVRLIDDLLKNGLAKLRKVDSNSILTLVDSWIMDDKLFSRQLALRLLIPLIAEPSFSNFPVVFRVIQPMLQDIPTGLQPDVMDVISALAKRTPVETTHFLCQIVDQTGSPTAAWLIRQSIQEFPEAMQQSLRQVARKY